MNTILKLKRKKKLLILIPSLVGGGAERSLINLLRKVDYHTYDIDLAVVSYVGVYIDQIPEQVSVMPLFKIDILVRVLAYLQKKIGFDLIFKRVIRNKLRSDYDNAICFLDSNFTDLLFFIKSKKKITWVHSSYGSYQNFSKFYKNESYRAKLINKRYSKLDAIVFVSEDAKTEFKQVFGNYTYMPIIYNLINNKEVIFKSQEFIPKRMKGFNFVAIGSLFPVKGFDRLIKAASIVKQKKFRFTIQIFGKGYLETDLNQLIEKHNLNEEVILKGFHGNPYPYLKNCDAFVMSSLSEALPTVLCEAMILKRPVIVTNCSGCREVVDHGIYGLMVDQNEHALANAMIDFIENDSMKTSFEVKSAERALLFDEDYTLKKYYQIFNL